MATSISRDHVVAVYATFASRDIDRLAAHLHEDVHWTISGPVDLLKFCGEYHGKAAAVRMLNSIVPGVYKSRRFEAETILVDGDEAAILARLSATKIDGRLVRYRVAHFAKFSGLKLIRFTSIIDSFNAVEEVLGHKIAITSDAPAAKISDDLVAI